MTRGHVIRDVIRTDTIRLIASAAAGVPTRWIMTSAMTPSVMPRHVLVLFSPKARLYSLCDYITDPLTDDVRLLINCDRVITKLH